MSNSQLIRSTIFMNRASGYALLTLAAVVIAAMGLGTLTISWLWLGLPLAGLVSFGLADWLANACAEEQEWRQ